MSFGFQRQQEIMLGDTALLDAYLYTQDGSAFIPQANITSVIFTIVGPNDTPEAPSINNAAGIIVGDGHGQFVATSINTVEGDYKGIATFLYDEDGNNGLVKTITVTYTVVDPFERTGPSPADGAVRQCWMFLEDCFDSELGGPWLRDMTLRNFDQTKLRGFIPQTLLAINNQMPFTAYTEDSFPWTGGDGEALFALGLLVQIERHLMRSYTEQPDETGSPVLWQNRTKYQSAWQTMYSQDDAEFKHWLNRWKLQQYDLSSGALLIGTKAGRMLPAPLRSRNVGRGFA